MIYLPFLQDRQASMTLEARTAMNPATLIPAVRKALLEVSHDIPISEIKTGQEQLEGGLVAERLIATLSNFFGALALLLAAIGLYGTLSHFVARKTREIVAAADRNIDGALGRDSHSARRDQPVL
jgi:hypothetical protein